MYRWNKFRSLLRRNFGNVSAYWERRMIKEFGNSTDDSSKGGLGRCESTCPSNVSGRDGRCDSSYSDDDEKDPKKDPERETDGTETQIRV